MLGRILADDRDVTAGSLRTGTDNALSIGRDVWRLRWRNQHTTAVDADADLHTTCGALLDAIALRESTAASGEDLDVDDSTVNLLVARRLPRDDPSETDQALRSIRDAVTGITARIWYLDEQDQWIEDTTPPPAWGRDGPKITKWVGDLLLPRLTTPPSDFGVELVAAVDDPSLHLYPSAITSKATDEWALRADGLQIGTTRGDSATLTVGKPGQNGDGPQRTAFIEVFGTPSATVTRGSHGPLGELNVAEAAAKIRTLLRRFRATDVPGEPLAHRRRSGAGYVDEHTLEARLLKGLVELQPHRSGAAGQLVLGDEQVARGSQFPTVWGIGARPRYLDAMLVDGTTPIAVELKVATGGQGRYYRRALVQAILYRHFITHAPALNDWFDEAGLIRADTRAAIAIPIPQRWLPRFNRDLDLLKAVAGRVGATVHVLDDRATPDWTIHADLPEPNRDEIELQTWRLVDALQRRWPRSLGLVVELHGAGGFYDQIELRHRDDDRLTDPTSGPRVSLNRPGSLWVFAQDGSFRWTWRGIWEHLAAGGDVDEAAATVGAIAGLPTEAPATGPTFGSVARDFLLAHRGEGWEWRCAWPWPEDADHWAEPFAPQLAHYRRGQPDADSIPTIARIWGAVHNHTCDMVVDQQTLRTFQGPGTASAPAQ